jgi:hypothetical protein
MTVDEAIEYAKAWLAGAPLPRGAMLPDVLTALLAPSPSA